jgi:hypothetical protein
MSRPGRGEALGVRTNRRLKEATGRGVREADDPSATRSAAKPEVCPKLWFGRPWEGRRLDVDRAADEVVGGPTE